MGRAEDLFNRLKQNREKAIDEMILDRQSEELFLDFKRSSDNGSGIKLHDKDRSNLAKAISGFGNSEGGIIVWGVDCSRKPDEGDIARAKVRIHNPKRFKSWLEGAISGCTVPPHPLVQNLEIESYDIETGFVVTYVPKSYLKPHQCVTPPQYYIRSGSDFVPTPHAVLAGMFGSHPQPFVFHQWTEPKVTIYHKENYVEFAIGFTLRSHGPGFAKDLYVSAKVAASKPEGPSNVCITLSDQHNWIEQYPKGAFKNLVSKDSFKLAPGALTQPLMLEYTLIPPFLSELSYEITFGHATSPVRMIEGKADKETLQQAFDELLKDIKDIDKKEKAKINFVKKVMALKDNDLLYHESHE